ncbi:hypothetical protein H5S09_04265 [Limosilactobacillus sp. STM2_1]|uniref:Phage tail protein n=1 Tax=Limosilactobacillus rudii TaxID=2759755 RepID=A0A7W3YMK3_9LACO|nr:hypothetical protein [Limosilactobacillus rudii]MBB1078977.1 hypothetical protein [Limosilactobacillus rudii]MBB1097158.1 hypothetical protein [Limosilactobacillus rudii]MCD7134151.1 DUF2439 domain-containing protein [Limosilactobacillus rudii]
MADFKRVIITRDGQQLMSDIMSKKKEMQFTRLIVSENEIGDIQDIKGNEQNYSVESISFDSLSTINQETSELSVHAVESFGGMTNPAVEVIASIDNTQLTKGYYMRTLGLCAADGAGNEILYAYTRADQPGYMPPYNGKTTSGAMFKITVTIGNTNQVNLMSGTTYASSYEVEEVRQQLNDLQTIVGYNENDVFGLEADFENNQFTRLAGAKNLTAGKDFDNLGPWKRRRCMVDYKTGDVVAYEGDPNFSETGTLAQSVTVNGKTYGTDTEYAIMVEQPKFYYRVVPVKTTDNGSGTLSLDKARYYVSSTPHIGFKIHPAFVVDGKELDKIYLASYLAKTTSSIDGYITSKKGVTDNALANDAVGWKEYLENTQKLNPNWKLSSLATYSISLLLFIIEYGNFNGTRMLKDRSFRGEKQINKNTIYLFDRKYSVLNNKVTIYDEDSSKIKSTFISASKGYISRFKYTENDDWAFYPIMNQGTSIEPIGASYDFSVNTNNVYVMTGPELFAMKLMSETDRTAERFASARLVLAL